jgi:hypothetical protein
MIIREELCPLVRLQSTNILLTLLLVEIIIAFEIDCLEEETSAKQHPRYTKPLNIEDTKTDPLVASFTTNLI